jgi:hypothetical protein
MTNRLPFFPLDAISQPNAVSTDVSSLETIEGKAQVRSGNIRRRRRAQRENGLPFDLASALREPTMEASRSYDTSYVLR